MVVQMVELEKALKTVFKTGKIVVGSRKTFNLTKSGKAKMVILSSNCPVTIRKHIKNIAQISNTSVYVSSLSSYELGKICNKPFNISIITIRDEGDSAILKLAEK
jgi:large subunit ribosomal protein L30e